MKRKIIISIIVVLILVGGGFFWWENQKDVRELNKNLPEGVRIVKTITGDYKVVNKIDGYEFKVPKEWRGVKEIEYIPEREAEGYKGTSLSIEGIKGVGRSVGIDRYIAGGDMKTDLESWAQLNFNTFGLAGTFTEEKVGNFNVVKTREEIHLFGEYVYFFKEALTIYAITGGSEEFIRYIIANGKW